MIYDFLVVGSGLFGSVFAYQAARSGRSVFVIDKREHLGGNVYCRDDRGIHVHQYGAHIFHTDSREIWDFVNHFVSFNRYTNSPVANYKGKLYNLPFNMNTFYQLWGVTTPEQAKEEIERQRADSIARLDGRDPQNLEEQALSLVGEDIYRTLIKGYTEKQWGRSCKDLPAFIIKRLPVRFIFDNNYFNDAFQGIPIGGYNVLVNGLLEGVQTACGEDFLKKKEHWEAKARTIVYTGALDEYYNFRFGKLSYRTVRFETEGLKVQNWQGNAVVNYTERDIPYTRIIEHKHFEPENPAFNDKYTVISREYPSEWKEGCDPFYPVNDQVNNELSGKYKALASTETRAIFGGRMADYRYYDMDDAIAASISLCRKVL